MKERRQGNKNEVVTLITKRGPTMVGPEIEKFENYTHLDALKSHFKSLIQS